MATKPKMGKKNEVSSSPASESKDGTGKSGRDVEKDPKDGRVHHRVPVQLLVDYRANGHYLFDFCRDLGTGGVFIETKQPLSHGSVVELTFTLPDSKETLEARGRVIWVQSEVPDKNLAAGMGVQFDEFTAEQRRILQSFVNRYSGPTTDGSSNKTA